MFAPIAAMIPVLLIDPGHVPQVFTGVFMERMVVFIKNYFPVFMLGAIFGKLMELSGFAQAIITSVVKRTGSRMAVVAIVLVAAILTYGGVSLFVVVFAVYPFAAVLFRQAGIPKRLIPACLALGAFSFTMDALPGSPQIQNIIPTTFFGTTAWAAPWLGLIGGLFIFLAGVAYLQWRVRASGDEGYGEGHINEPVSPEEGPPVNLAIAVAPLIAVVALNKIFSLAIPSFFGPLATTSAEKLPGLATQVALKTDTVAAVWSLEAALLIGIVLIIGARHQVLRATIGEGTKLAVGGAMLASMNTASEYGFGAVIAALPGFLTVRDAIQVPNPLLNSAIVTNVLAGITGSASGGMSIALAAMSDRFIASANAAGIPLEVLHRVTAMASGGMDTLPHNGAVITCLAVTGLTHRQSYPDIFAIMILKVLACFLVIGIYSLTGLV
jgi:H+/gluconate symporter-like permease